MSMLMLQVAEQERTTYVQNLMPLLAEFDLQPPVSDAHSMVSHIKVCVVLLVSLLFCAYILNVLLQ